MIYSRNINLSNSNAIHDNVRSRLSKFILNSVVIRCCNLMKENGFDTHLFEINKHIRIDNELP